MRLRYFDILKGIAIFLVVMGHVITMCIRDIDRALAFKIIGQIHMPLFFFIAGWFSSKVNEQGMLSAPKIGRRFRQLMIPMAVVSTLWIFYFPHSGLLSPFDSTFEGLWSSVGKNGYWFPVSLMVITLIYAAIRPVLNRCRTAGSASTMAVGVSAAFIVGMAFAPDAVQGWLSSPMWTPFIAAFLFGAIARRHRDGFQQLVNNPSVVTLAIVIGSLAMYYCCYPWEYTTENETLDSILIALAQGLLHLCLVVVAFRLAMPSDSNEGTTIGISRIFEALGRESLGIYLIHYFLLFPMMWLQPWMQAMNVAIVPVAATAALAAALITAVAMGIIAIIKTSPLLSTIILGATGNAKKQ